MSRLLLAALLVSAFTSVPALGAQDASILAPGTRVRLTTPALDASQQTGQVVSATGDSITFRSDASPITRHLAVSDLIGIEASGGMETHRGRDALYGLAIGGGAGALIGAITYKKPDPQTCWFFCVTRGGDAIAGAVLGSIAGTIIGAFIVGSLDKTERWTVLRKTASFFVAPTSNGARVAFATSF